MDKPNRAAFIERNTKETRISLSLDLDGSGAGEVDTGIGFFNHMLELFKKHALVDLTVKCAGDLDVDYHHTVEDVGLVLGQALNRAAASRATGSPPSRWTRRSARRRSTSGGARSS